MSQENVEIVRQGYETFARGDIASMLELVDESMEWRAAIADAMGVEPIRGKVALKRFFTVELPEGFTDFEAIPRSIEDLGNAVLVETRYSGMGRASGAPFVADVFSLIRLEAGKLVAFRDYETRAEALEAAGRSE